MLRWSEGQGEWTELMDQHYGDGNSLQSQFWDYYFANKRYFTDEYTEDDVVQAALSRDVRSILPKDTQDPLFQEALTRLQEQYFSEEEEERWTTYPDLVGQAEEEYADFQDQFVYVERPQDKDGERDWWNDRTQFRKDHPVMTWHYYYNDYVKWWGEVDLTEATPIAAKKAAPRLPAPVPTAEPTPEPTPAPTPAPSKPSKKKDDGAPSVPGAPPPPPPPPS